MLHSIAKFIAISQFDHRLQLEFQSFCFFLRSIFRFIAMARRRRRKSHNSNFGRPRLKKVKKRTQLIVKKKPVKKAENDGQPSDATAKGKIEKSALKMALNTIIHPDKAALLTEIFYSKSLNATKIMSMGSLLMLHRVNTAFDEGDTEFFRKKNGRNGKEDVIADCFRSVCLDNIDNSVTAQMPKEFHDMVKKFSPNYEWPTRYLMTRAFDTFVSLYRINMKTNLVTWCWSRLTYFLRMKCYQFTHNLAKPQRFKDHEFDETDARPYPDFDNIDVRNAIKNLMLDEDWTYDEEKDGEIRKEKMEILVEEVWARSIGLFEKKNENTVLKYVENNWFESMWMFLMFQNDIEIFLSDMAPLRKQWAEYSRDKVNNEKPSLPRLPQVRNFTVVPLCDTKLKHVAFDHVDLIALIGQIESGNIKEILKKDDQEEIKLPKLNVCRDYSTFYAAEEYKDAAWGLLFNMKEIRKLEMKTKKFNHRIMTDSAAVSVELSRPKRKGAGITYAQVKSKYDKNVYKGECAIDPGQKTYVACVHRDLETGVEVIENRNENSMHIVLN